MQTTINIIHDMDSLIGLNLKETIEHIESKLSHCYDIAAKDNVLGEYGYSCGIQYHKPFNGTLYVDLKSSSIKRMISLHFSKETNLLETYRITCKK
ncbi:hypothetical protein UFOVP457_46 [uncultured Caudovirales phage]|uniref:Uncharacterized protein n=1 Tax=uncultured Caudovirales phage TaxID=2100421 RepID=A0A6J5MHC6_9CAUD|nr:hypothetical protein UFOVP457_46 [uncultured Caudovirales phage]